MPNHPLLIISNVQSDEESHRQNAQLEQAGLKLAKKLIEPERTEHAEPGPSASLDDGPQSAQSHDDMTRPGRQYHNGISIDIPMSVRVSASFERLLGYSQSEVRQWFAREGETALFQLIRADSWSRFMELDFEARWDGRPECCLYVMCLTKWNTSIPCLLHCTNSFGNEGILSKRIMSFIRLPS